MLMAQVIDPLAPLANFLAEMIEKYASKIDSEISVALDNNLSKSKPVIVNS